MTDLFCTLLPVSAALWGYREGPGRDSETATREGALWGIYEESLHEGRVCSQHWGSQHVPQRRWTTRATSISWSTRSVTEWPHRSILREHPHFNWHINRAINIQKKMKVSLTSVLHVFKWMNGVDWVFVLFLMSLTGSWWVSGWAKCGVRVTLHKIEPWCITERSAKKVQLPCLLFCS